MSAGIVRCGSDFVHQRVIPIMAPLRLSENPSMARKDKKQVIGEPMTDEQIRAFLHTLPETGMNPDHHALLRAYRSLRGHDFERFLGFFIAEGRNPDATDPLGRTALEIISSHQQGSEYADALRQAGGH
jgi:hypothetical protein